MMNPKLLAREPDNEIENNDFADKRFNQPRADTTQEASVTKKFYGGAEGTVHATRFNSVGVEDRGGVVLRLTIDSMGQAFVPYALNIDGGIEIHLAGATEAEHTIAALNTIIENKKTIP
jgi:hypothetical protein